MLDRFILRLQPDGQYNGLCRKLEDLYLDGILQTTDGLFAAMVSSRMDKVFAQPCINKQLCLRTLNVELDPQSHGDTKALEARAQEGADITLRRTVAEL